MAKTSWWCRECSRLLAHGASLPRGARDTVTAVAGQTSPLTHDQCGGGEVALSQRVGLK